jgi:hypothetical protein
MKTFIGSKGGLLGRRRAAVMALLLAIAGCDGGSGSAPAPPPSPPPARSSSPVTTSAPTAPLATSVPAAAPAPSAAAAPASSAVEPPPEWIAAQHILVTYKGAKGAPKGVTRSKAEAKKRAEEAADRAKQGDFSALVKEYSEDSGTLDRQGNLGKFNREKMVKPFSDAAFVLKVGEVSAVVETPFGFHVIKRNQ